MNYMHIHIAHRQTIVWGRPGEGARAGWREPMGGDIYNTSNNKDKFKKRKREQRQLLLVHVAVQQNWDLGAGIGSGQSEDPRGAVSPLTLARPAAPTTPAPQPALLVHTFTPNAPCRVEPRAVVEEPPGRRQKARL